MKNVHNGKVSTTKNYRIRLYSIVLNQCKFEPFFFYYNDIQITC